MTLIVHTESRQTSLLPAFRRVVPIFGTAMVFSFFINVLMFVSPLYMLQIYDRVVTSRSEATLFALTVLAGVLMVVYALLEGLRSRLLVRAGLIYDKTIAGDVFEAVHRANLRSPSKHVQCLRDVDVLREFLTGSGLIALCDFPWFPIFVAVSFILHPWFGYISLVGSAITLGLTILTELVTRKQLGLANRASGRAIQGAQAVFRNTEVIQALGMIKPVKRLWMKEHDEVLGCQAIASDRAGILMTLTKFSRFFLQIVILGTGAYLVIHQELTAGAIVAASILIGRALQPIEMAVANWKGFIAARGSYGRIAALFQQSGSIPVRLPLPRPSGAISAQGLICGAPGTPHVPILKGLAFELGAGEALGIVGPSAAGKSSLARVLVGVWPLLRGTIRLDGHELSHWDPENLGQWVGYLPQDVELFTGTVAENIARFQDCDANEIIEAADLAGSHELIQLLPDGYNSQIGENGCALSGGQRQRIGLARAMFRKPPLIVLDEPNASLDAAGEEALMRAMQRLRLAGSTIVIVTHKVNILAFTDKILVIADGLAQAFGPRDTIMQQIVGPRIVPAPSRPVLEEAAEGTGT